MTIRWIDTVKILSTKVKIILLGNHRQEIQLIVQLI